jgi:hypothetical protein
MMDYFETGDAAQIVHDTSELNGLYCEILEVGTPMGVRLIPSGRSGRIDAQHLKRIGGPDILQSIMVQRTGRPHWPERMINDGRVEDTDLIAPIPVSMDNEVIEARHTTAFEGGGGESGGAGASGSWEELASTESVASEESTASEESIASEESVASEPSSDSSSDQ